MQLVQQSPGADEDQEAAGTARTPAVRAERLDEFERANRDEQERPETARVSPPDKAGPISQQDEADGDDEGAPDDAARIAGTLIAVVHGHVPRYGRVARGRLPFPANPAGRSVNGVRSVRISA